MTFGELVLGVLIGLTIGFLAVGIVLVYKANRFLNLAHAQFGVFSAVLYEVSLCERRPCAGQATAELEARAPDRTRAYKLLAEVMRSISKMPGGNCVRSSLRYFDSPLRTSSSITAPVPLPIPSVS